MQFLFSAGEQSFFQEHGFSHQPERCRDCRAKKRQDLTKLREQAKGPTSVVCDGCGEGTEVPFVPYRGQPVYCQRCFQGRRRLAEV